MNPKLKKKWVKALMSGEYEQGDSALFSGGKYCCLGVLGNICGYPHLSSDIYLETGPLYEELPFEVQEQLAYLNDHGVPFPVIAGFIQENL